jgi:hypothetical protein
MRIKFRLLLASAGLLFLTGCVAALPFALVGGLGSVAAVGGVTAGVASASAAASGAASAAGSSAAGGAAQGATGATQGVGSAARTAALPKAGATPTRMAVQQSAGPGYASQSGPGFQQSAGPGYASQSGPGFQQSAGPGSASQSGPGFQQSAGPGGASQSGPGYRQSAGPGGASQSGPGYSQSAGPGYAKNSGPGYSQSADFRPPPEAIAVGGAALIATAASSGNKPTAKFSCNVTCGGNAYAMTASCPANRTPTCQCQDKGAVVVCK